MAASALNQQPWHFIAVTDEAVRKEIAKIAPNGKYIATAPVCIVTVAKKDSGYKVEDGSAATQNMLNAAKAHGLGSCWVAGYGKPYAEEICKLLGVPGKLYAYLYDASGSCGKAFRTCKKAFGRGFELGKILMEF